MIAFEILRMWSHGVLYLYKSLVSTSVSVEEGEELFIWLTEWSAKKFERHIGCDLSAATRFVRSSDDRSSVGKNIHTGLWSSGAMDASDPILYQPTMAGISFGKITSHIYSLNTKALGHSLGLPDMLRITILL